MTYIVLMMGTLNPTHSFTRMTDCRINVSNRRSTRTS